MGTWQSPQFRGMGLLTHGLQLTGRETRATFDPPPIGRCTQGIPWRFSRLAVGAGISRVFAVARIYPQATSTVHLQVGAGSITGWDNSPWNSNHTGSSWRSNRHGSGWEAGIGYDVMVSTHAAFTPFLRYSSGTAGNLKMSVVTAGVGFTWR